MKNIFGRADYDNVIKEIMKNDFLPPSPMLENSIMQSIIEEENSVNSLEQIESPDVFSFKSWVIIGLFVIISLSSTFFGMNFEKIANIVGFSFLLAISITIGLVLTSYCALFIGSHLKEISKLLGIRCE